MNYLAHSFLSGNNEDLLIGNLVTDLIKKRDEVHYSVGIRHGIELHRKIDSFTDNHRLVKESLEMVRTSQGKYAPVVLDILWDYFLCNNWERYSNEDLQVFSNGVYKLLEKNYSNLQDAVVRRFKSMIAHNFLMSCADQSALISTFEHLNKRVRFSSNFAVASDIVIEHEQELNVNFNVLFTEMISYVDSICKF